MQIVKIELTHIGVKGFMEPHKPLFTRPVPGTHTERGEYMRFFWRYTVESVMALRIQLRPALEEGPKGRATGNANQSQARTCGTSRREQR